MHKLIVAALAALCLTACLAPAGEPVTFTIDNPLKLAWPWELTHKDFPAGTFDASRPYVVTMSGARRPAQIEVVKDGNDLVDRVWFIATLGRKSGPVDVTVSEGRIDSPLSLEHKGRFTTLRNAGFSLKLRAFEATGEPVAFRDAPHWLAGLSIGDSGYYGAASLKGSAKVRRSVVRPLTIGPVFCDVEIRYEFADAAVDGNAAALPMIPGKQTHTYKPNEIPTVSVPKVSPHYRVVLRVVMGDPWVEVLERYHFPDGRDQDHGHRIFFGNDAANRRGPRMPVDTAMFVRWFEYDSFGGNTSLQVLPARQRDIQKGRPFANIQPRWTQRGSGAQELLLTSGGKDPNDPNVPCVGVVATFASKWVAPYQSIISGYAAGGDRGWFDFPLTTGRGGGRHYGQRSYAIVAGPRKQFDSTGRINNLIRRHTDWTLVAQMNKYILRWERDPNRAGPHILMSPAKLAKVRKQYKTRADTPATRALRRTRERMEQAAGQSRAIRAELADLQARLKTADSEPAKAELQTKIADAKRQLKRVGRLLRNDDAKLYEFIAEGKAGRAGLPKVDLWIGRRYQDDFLNPTTYTRRVHGWGWPDLYAGGKPIGGALHAAAGYIFSDLDHWPGWHNGWSPGNPNFHTDKYMVALYAGAALLDHPHADRWLAFGLSNFRDDLSRVLLRPDGVGWECPGYSGYSLNLQLKVAKVIANTGFGNPIAANPMTRATGVWHRKLITPRDARLGLRHEAPHGDTHRWTAGLGLGFAKLAAYYADDDPNFAREMMGTWQLLVDSRNGDGWQPTLSQALMEIDTSIEPLEAGRMDWSSQAFYGFGAILRDEFGREGESMCSVKAGPARGHYHNDELAYHFYSGRTPISLDYNCSYHPRADHAVLHNSMSFGREGTVLHNARNRQVPAHEQLYGTARVGAFVRHELADVLVAERTSGGLTMSPIDPHDHEFSRRYPSRKVQPITHRRTLAMVKHPTSDALGDYLVVLDQTNASEPQQLNVHLLARDAKVTGRRVVLDGQLDKDILVHLAAATDPNVSVRSYHYLADERRPGPALYAARPNESTGQWHQRLTKLRAAHEADSLPIEGLDATAGLSAEKWHERIEATDGLALAVPPHWNDRWTWGEYQVWLRIETKPATPVLWVLYAWPKSADMPTIETLRDGLGVRLTAGDEVETVSLTGSADAPGKLMLTRDGETVELLDLSKLPALGEIPQKPLK